MGRTNCEVEASGRVKALGGVETLLLLISNLFAGLWGLASLSCFPIRLAGGLLQELHQVQDSKAIVIEI